jgi:hypothetical protein
VTLEVIKILLAVKFVVTSEAFEGIFHLLLAGHVIPFLAALETLVSLEVSPDILHAEIVLLTIPKEFCQLQFVKIAIFSFLFKVGGDYLVLNAAHPRLRG